MEINPCEEEMKRDYWKIAVFAFVALYPIIIGIWDTYMYIPYIAMCCFVIFLSVRKLIYLGRTITLTPKGCTISILKYTRTYEWKDLKVQFCKNEWIRRPTLTLDVHGPGIIICKKSIEIPERKVPGFCRTRHPLTSVFIRFRSDEDDKFDTPQGDTDFTYGYAVEEDIIVGYLKSIGVY